MPAAFFSPDPHGPHDRDDKLLEAIGRERPAAVFLGGDLLPHAMSSPDFLDDYLLPRLEELRARLGTAYPRVFVILGNDDARVEEAAVEAAGARGGWGDGHDRPLARGAVGRFGFAGGPPPP